MLLSEMPDDTVGALHMWRLAIYSCGSDQQAVHLDTVITNDLAASDAKLGVPRSPLLQILQPPANVKHRKLFSEKFCQCSDVYITTLSPEQAEELRPA
jgi:hypothetical protein